MQFDRDEDTWSTLDRWIRLALSSFEMA